MFSLLCPHEFLSSRIWNVIGIIESFDRSITKKLDLDLVAKCDFWKREHFAQFFLIENPTLCWNISWFDCFCFIYMPIWKLGSHFPNWIPCKHWYTRTGRIKSNLHDRLICIEKNYTLFIRWHCITISSYYITPYTYLKISYTTILVLLTFFPIQTSLSMFQSLEYSVGKKMIPQFFTPVTPYFACDLVSLHPHFLCPLCKSTPIKKSLILSSRLQNLY